MLVIAIVVSICIKLTKNKLDNITSYTYYSAYQTINSVTKEMLRDFDAENEEYTTSYFSPLTYAKTEYSCPQTKVWKYEYPNPRTEESTGFGSPYFSYTTIPNDCLNKVLDKFSSSLKNVKICGGLHQNSYAVTDDYNLFMPSFDYEDDPMACTKPCMRFVWNGTGSNSAQWEGNNCGSYSLRAWVSSSGYCNLYSEYRSNFKEIMGDIGYCSTEFPDVPENPSCTPVACIGGNEFDMTSCGCVCKKTAPSVIPCGKEWNETQCRLVDITPWPPVCPAGQIFKDDDSICGCVNEPTTVPRKGENFCKLFVSYSNTAQLAEDDECSGSAIAENENDFTDKDADIILRNGMRLYNVSQDPAKIDILSGNSKGVTHTKADGTEIDIDEWGYTVYIDIDGSSGNSKLWEDVYPFYVTLSGNVIPAYDLVNEGLSGGDSRLHLQTSGYDEFIDNDGRHIQWVTKSKTFKESACTMGYVKSGTQYCSGVSMNTQCNQQGHDCRLKTIMPVKFFQ